MTRSLRLEGLSIPQLTGIDQRSTRTRFFFPERVTVHSLVQLCSGPNILIEYDTTSTIDYKNPHDFHVVLAPSGVPPERGRFLGTFSLDVGDFGVRVFAVFYCPPSKAADSCD